MLLSVPASAANLTLNWADNSVNEDGFKVERRLGANGVFAEVAVVSSNVTTYDDVTVDNQVYCYQVKAFNLAGDSTPSNIACGPKPATPGSLTITITITVTVP